MNKIKGTKKDVALVVSCLTGLLIIHLLVSLTPASSGTNPTASVYVTPQAPVGAGEITVTLVTSTPVVVPPEALCLMISDGSMRVINLSGTVPGDTFTGILRIEPTMPQGDAEFVLFDNTLVDAQGVQGSEIVAGRILRIDTTAPTAPRELEATFNLN